MDKKQDHEQRSTGCRILAALRAITIRLAILVFLTVASWPVVSRYAISNGVNAVIAYYWILGTCIALMLVHWAYRKFKS